MTPNFKTFYNGFNDPISFRWYGINFDERLQYTDLKNEKILLINAGSSKKVAELTDIAPYYAYTRAGHERKCCIN